MDERGQTTAESLLILVSALSIVLVGLVGLKERQPKRWNDMTVAVSDVSRDLSWQLNDAVAQWSGHEALRSVREAWINGVPPPAPAGPSLLRPAPDPLQEVRALR